MRQLASLLVFLLVFLLAGCAAAAGTPTIPALVTADATPRPVRADFSYPYDSVAGVSLCAAAERYEPCDELASETRELTLEALVRPLLLGDISVDAPMHRAEVEAWVLGRRGIARSQYGTPHRSSDEGTGAEITSYVHLDALPGGGEALRLITTRCTPEALAVGAEDVLVTDEADASGCSGCEYTAIARYVYAADGRLLHHQEFSETCECVDSRFADIELRYTAGMLSGVRQVEYVHPTCREFGDGWDAAQLRYADGRSPAEDHWLECVLERDRQARPTQLACQSDQSGAETWGRVVLHYAD